MASRPKRPLTDKQLAQRRAALAAGREARIAAVRARHIADRERLPQCGKPTRSGRPCQRPLVNGKCLTHDTMTPEARAELCRTIASLGAAASNAKGQTTRRLAARMAQVKENHPGWKGDAAKRHTGRIRAQHWYPAQPCEVCGAPPANRQVHRHHKDGNTLNNDPSNIQFLCVKHHAEAHGGSFSWFHDDGD